MAIKANIQTTTKKKIKERNSIFSIIVFLRVKNNAANEAAIHQLLRKSIISSF